MDDRLLDRLDASGRPLGETASALVDTVETEIVACPFGGDRAGGRMNLTAWQQVAACWPAVLAALRARTGPTASDAWRAAARCRWAVLALPDPVSDEVAAVFKTALGLHRPLTSWLLLQPGAASRPLADLCPPEALLDRLDAEGWLVGSHLVCSGPPGRIVEAWEALCAPDPPGPADEATQIADRAAEIVAGSWAVLGATRAALRAGRCDEAPGWSPVAAARPEWPQVLHLLAMRGPGALVREVPRFEPEWALHVFAAPPEAVVRAADGARRALDAPRPLAALDEVWRELRAEVGI